MSKSLLGLLLVVAGVLAFHLSQMAVPSNAVWEITFPTEIAHLQPLGEGALVLGREGLLARLDAKGEITHRVQLAKSPRHLPVVVDGVVVVVDKDGGIQGLAVADLGKKWEATALAATALAPLALPDHRVLVGSTKEVVFALAADSGQPAWESHFKGEVQSVAVGDGYLACVHGFTLPKSGDYRLSGVSLDDGGLLWTYPEPVSDRTPFAYRDVFLFCTGEGRPVIVDQATGKVLYRHGVGGLRIAGMGDDRLLLLAEGGSRLECFSLLTGNSWSATLPSPIQGYAAVDGKVLMADSSALRSVSAEDGHLLWERDLGQIFPCITHGQGLLVTYKDSFIARKTYGSYFRGGEREPVWTVMDRAMFYPPVSLAQGDVVACRSGAVAMLPVGPQMPASGISLLPPTEPTASGTPGLVNFWQIRPGMPQPRPRSAATGSGIVPTPEMPSPASSPVRPASSGAPIDGPAWE